MQARPDCRRRNRRRTACRGVAFIPACRDSYKAGGMEGGTV